MGRAARWLKALLGGKKAPAEDPKPFKLKEKKRWGFVKSFREKDKITETEPPPPPRRWPPAAASYREADDGDEHNKRAIAVAAATAAVAEAAVAAAQAAAAVVRLTSGGAKREEPAAVKIQAAFRGYLARRALRALKGLVKLQALVRGNIVRKQAAETLRCMQALVRVQARARACRALRADRNQLKFGSNVHPGPATPEKFEQPVRSNSRRSSPLKRNSSKQASFSDGFDQDRAQSSSDFRWLGQWMEERYWEPTSKSGMVAMRAPLDDEKSAKILEIDTGKPHYNKQRKSDNRLPSSPLASDHHSRSFTTSMLDSPSKDSTTAQQSVPSPSSICMQDPLSPLQFPIVEGSDYGLSPQFFSASTSRPASSRRGPVTPAKSDCSRSLFSECSDCPSYMANTESSRAKARSQSAPKQRPVFEKSSSVIRRLSGSSGATAGQRSSSSLHSEFTNKAYPGSGRLDRLGMPLRI